MQKQKKKKDTHQKQLKAELQCKVLHVPFRRRNGEILLPGCPMSSLLPEAVSHSQQKGLFSTPYKKLQLLLKSLDGFCTECARLLPGLAVDLTRAHHTFQELEVNLCPDTLNTVQKLQDVLVCFVCSIRTVREKAKFPKLWVEHGTVQH